MSYRKSISTGTRFEILKRDKFTCKYCGRSSPEVTLHVDHIIAPINGGDSSASNLVTACQDCNIGKSDKSLDVFPEALPSQAESLQEKLLINQKFHNLPANSRTEVHMQFETISNYWSSWGNKLLEPSQVPPLPAFSVKRMIHRLPIPILLECIDITWEKFQSGRIKTPLNIYRYFHRTCWKAASDCR